MTVVRKPIVARDYVNLNREGGSLDFGHYLFDHASESFTVEMWFRSYDLPGGYVFYKYLNGSTAAWLVNIGSSGINSYKYQIKMQTTGGTSIYSVYSGVTTALDNQWHLMTFVVDRTSATKHAYLYVDAVLVHETTDIGTATISNSASVHFTVGYSGLGLGMHAKDLRQYSRALTFAEVQDRFANDTYITDGLVNRFAMNDGADTGMLGSFGNAFFTHETTGIGFVKDSLSDSLGLGAGVTYVHERGNRIPLGCNLAAKLMLFTDQHHMDSASDQTVYVQAVATKATHEAVNALVNLGDLVYGQDTKAHQLTYFGNLHTAIHAIYPGAKYIAVGNHDCENNTSGGRCSQADIIGALTNWNGGSADTLVDFDIGGVHFVVLSINTADPDANFAFGPTLRSALTANLAAHPTMPTVIFTHCRQDQTYPGNHVTVAGDTEAQFWCWNISGGSATNSTDNVVYWSIATADGVHTINLKKTNGGTVVASGSRTGNGAVTLSAVGGSGLSGSVNLIYSTDKADNAGQTLTIGEFTGGTLWSYFGGDSAAVRTILEAAGNVKLVVSGHVHSVNTMSRINDITYLDIPTSKNTASCALLKLYTSGTDLEWSIDGFNGLWSYSRRSA